MLNNWYLEFIKLIGSADSSMHQDLRGTKCACGEDDFFGSVICTETLLLVNTLRRWKVQVGRLA